MPGGTATSGSINVDLCCVMPSGSGAAAMSPNPTFAQLAASLTKKTLFTVAR